MLVQADGVGVSILESLGVDLILLRQRLSAASGPPTAWSAGGGRVPDAALRAEARLAAAGAEPSSSRSDPALRIEREVARPEMVDSLLRELPEWFGIDEAIEEYAATRSFYEALGDQGLEEYPAGTIWPGDPCLVMGKHLGCPG
jgi:hypothetical protein